MTVNCREEEEPDGARKSNLSETVTRVNKVKNATAALAFGTRIIENPEDQQKWPRKTLVMDSECERVHSFGKVREAYQREQPRLDPRLALASEFLILIKEVSKK